jgi:hypothetical protein
MNLTVMMKKQFALALLALVLCVPVHAELFGPWNVSLDIPRGGFPPVFTDTPVFDGTSAGGPGGLLSELDTYTLTLTFAGSDVSAISGALTLSQLPGTPSQAIDLSSGWLATDGGLTYSQTFGPSSALSGYDPNTEWTLDLFDGRDSGPENTLLTWEVQITAVPEPSALALALCGSTVLLGSRRGRDWARNFVRR